MSEARPHVFEYQAHGAFVADMIRWMSEQNHYMSMRWVARRLAMSHGTLSKVARGKSCLAEDKARTLATLLHLDPAETEYFELLVAKDSAATRVAQEQLERVVAGKRRIELANTARPQETSASEDWLVPVVLEQLSLPGALPEPATLAAQIRPQAPPERVADALNVLRQTGRLPDEVQAGNTPAATKNNPSGSTYHRQMIALGAESIERWPSDMRFISGFTASVSSEGLERLRRRLGEVVEVMLEECERDSAADRVVQLNVQLFPLTTAVDEDE